MKKLLLAALIFGAAIFAPHKALATTCSIPNTFTNGTTADASQVNANFTALQSCGNAIDFRNIGGAGIYASQIIPTTTGQATFGGNIGYVFSVSAGGQELLLTGPTTASNYLQFTNSSGPGSLYVGLENSTGSSICGPSAAYAAVLCTGAAREIDLGTNNVTAMTIATNQKINIPGLSASQCVGTDSSKNLISSGAGCLTANVATTSPITVSGGTAPNIGCATCLTTAGGQTISGTDTFSGVTSTQGMTISTGGLVVSGAGGVNTGSGGVVSTGGASISGGNTGVTTASASGLVTFNATGEEALFGGASTGSLWAQFTNSSGPGSGYVGLDSSAGGAILGNGSDAYALVIGTGGARDVTISTNNTLALKIDTSQNAIFQKTIQGSSNGSTISYHPPVYTAAGAAVASTEHIVSGNATTGSFSCAANTSNCTNVSVTLSGAAAFTSAAAYQCTATVNQAGSLTTPYPVSIITKTATTFAIAISNPYSTAITTQTAQFDYICVGN